jgi:diguanylate cyclase (GGDEF)-like protein/PAS domain S-box-containing protein
MVQVANPKGRSPSDERYRHVFEDGPIGIWLVDGNLRTLEMNPAMSQMLGYTAEELGQRTFADVTHPDDLQSNLAMAAQLIAGEISTYTVEKRYVTKGGDPISVDTTVTAVRDDTDEFSYAIAVVRDVSERRDAEMALADRGRHLADAEALAHAGSFTSDPRCDEIEWSDELYRVFGIEPRSIDPTLDIIFDIVHPDDLAMVRARITTLMRTGEPFDMEYRINRMDGEAAWVRARASVDMGAAGPERLFGSVQDISDGKRLEESLAAVAAIVQYSDGAIVGLTPECVITTWNPAAERLFGYAAADMIGCGVDILLPAGARRRASVLERVARGDRVEHHETEVVRKDGSLLSISLNASPIRGDQGNVVGISSIAYDITEARRAQDALRGAHDDLARSVAQLERRNTEVTLLNEMGDLLQSCADLDEVSKVIRKYARQLFPGQAGAVSVIAPSRNLLEMVATWGEIPGDGPFGPQDCWALRRGRVHRVDDADDELICPHVGAAPPGGYVCVPMMAQGETLGLLHLQASAPEGAGSGIAGDARQHLAVPVAEHLSLALANFTLRESLRNQSIRDPLTGLFNRRYMDEPLQRELARASRNHSSVAVLAIDVDHFKAFNDAYGHPAGDALLTSLGALLQARIRSEDIACRSGGEEFNLILPDCGGEDAVARADELRVAAKGLEVGVRGRSYGGITISVGVAAFPANGADSATLLHEADAALYRAKAEGRDRVCVSLEVAEPTGPAGQCVSGPA